MPLQVTTEPAPAPPTYRPPVAITLTGDALLTLGFVGWLVWDRLLRTKITSKLSGSYAPIEEERKLNNLLAQIGLITNASRVVLGAFHNGAVGVEGYHLTKLSTINSYTAPGRLPMAVPIRDLPVGRIMYELEELLRAEGTCWTTVEYHDDLPDPCKDHLRRNNIHRMHNRLIKIGGINGLPIGILSLQYDENERRRAPIRDAHHIELLEDLYDQIAHIMRRRILSPSPIKKLWMHLTRKNAAELTR